MDKRMVHIKLLSETANPSMALSELLKKEEEVHAGVQDKL